MSTEIKKVEFLSVRNGCGAVCSNTILKAERRERLIALAPQNRVCSRQASYIMCYLGYTQQQAFSKSSFHQRPTARTGAVLRHHRHVTSTNEPTYTCPYLFSMPGYDY